MPFIEREILFLFLSTSITLTLTCWCRCTTCVGSATYLSANWDMHQTVLMHTDVYKSSEIGDVGNDAGQFHSFDEVVCGLHSLCQTRKLQSVRGVANRFLQLFHDVCEGGHANFCGDVPLQTDSRPLVFVLDQLGDGALTVFCHLFYDTVTLCTALLSNGFLAR